MLNAPRAILPAFGLLAACAASAESWTPPAGIPKPPFGIDETHLQYAGRSGYREAGNGPYSVYVDNSNSSCSDRGPGTADEPHCSIPERIEEPGTVVEIHGGPYDYDGDNITINANGSADAPVFIRGVDDGKGFPVILDADKATVQGQYLVIENLVFNRTQLRNSGGGRARYGRSYIAMRNIEVAHHPDKNGTALAGDNIVFVNGHVHHNQGDDRHGITVRSGSTNVWILDNHIHHNGGDAIQFCHGCKSDPPRNVFIGRNLMHSDRENAVDLKYGENIVVSENVMHSYLGAKPDVEWCFDDNSACGKFSSGSDGSAVVIGSDGAPVNPWIIFNEIHDATQGVRIEEVHGAHILGNTIHGIRNRAFALEKHGDPLHIVANTIIDARVGIDQYWRDNFSLQLHDNIFANMREQTFKVGVDVAKKSDVSNNVFWNSGEPVQMQWGRDEGSLGSSSDLNRALRGKGNTLQNPGLDVTTVDGLSQLLPGAAVDLPALATTPDTYDELLQRTFGPTAGIAERLRQLRKSDNSDARSAAPDDRTK